MQENNTYIYGKHAVLEVLDARPEIVQSVYVDPDLLGTDLRETLKQKGIPRKDLSLKKLPGNIPADAVHQGHVAEIQIDSLLVPYEQFMSSLTLSNDTAIAILGEVQDPHNVGAIIRSAAAFGIHAVLIPEHRQSPVTGTVIKVSAGAAFRIPLVQIGNVNNAIRDLKERGFWAYGLTGDAEQSIHTEGFEKPSVIVVGNEAGGIREKTLENCDIPLKIPMSASVESLNASVAASVAFYAWRAQHPFEGV